VHGPHALPADREDAARSLGELDRLAAVFLHGHVTLQHVDDLAARGELPTGCAGFAFPRAGCDLLDVEKHFGAGEDVASQRFGRRLTEGLLGEFGGGDVEGAEVDRHAPDSTLNPVSENLWETHAGWWIDGFTDGADPEYEEQILPLAARELGGRRRVLDVGCGDGQVSRLAARLGAEVIGIDPTWNCVSVADQRGTAVAQAGAAGLPFADASFDAVVACLVFEHIRDVDEAIAEVARVLQTDGRFCFFLNHPLLQTPNSGWIDDQFLDPPEQYWRIGPYLVEDETIEEVEKDVFIPFIHRPLSRYVNTLAANGLLVERMEEPAPPAGFLAKAEEYVAASTIPRLLYLRTRKV
jgi:SAM-dependent methyltransferase